MSFVITCLNLEIVKWKPHKIHVLSHEICEINIQVSMKLNTNKVINPLLTVAAKTRLCGLKPVHWTFINWDKLTVRCLNIIAGFIYG